MSICKSCCFIGHRKIEVSNLLEEKLKRVLIYLIEKQGVTNFLFGSKSQFNDFCHVVVTKLQQKYFYIKKIAYTCKSESVILSSEKEKWEQIYSKFFKKQINLFCYEQEAMYKTKYKSNKASYIERNFAMIDDSDFCVFYYDEKYFPPQKDSNKKSYINSNKKSGTKIAYQYAKRKNKRIIRINII